MWYQLKENIIIFQISKGGSIRTWFDSKCSRSFFCFYKVSLDLIRSCFIFLTFFKTLNRDFDFILALRNRVTISKIIKYFSVLKDKKLRLTTCRLKPLYTCTDNFKNTRINWIGLEAQGGRCKEDFDRKSSLERSSKSDSSGCSGDRWHLGSGAAVRDE